jgi:Dolichyl-phosphate-mannose-protein mannosyltransferase
VVNLEANEIPSAGLPAPWSRYADWVRRNPLACALAIQAALLFYRLDLLEPWGDEWFTLTTVPLPLKQIRTIVQSVDHPPLYFFLLHFWIQIPWPASPLVKMRAMSVLWTLLATVIFDRLWLVELEPRVRRRFLLLWVLSPCLLLYARMARSYSMQLALALLTIYAASKWLARPQSLRWLFAYICCLVALLYTHYLPGLAIIASAWIVFLTNTELSRKIRIMIGGSSVLLIGLLYLPWLTSLFGALGEWRESDAYRVGNQFIDQLVRIAFWFVSFSFGETISAPGIVIGAALTPVVAYALYRGIRSRPQWLGLVAAASLIGYVGVSRWSGFPFTPSHLLFVLPFFLILLVKGIDASHRGSLVFAGLLVVYISGDYSYFAKIGYLDKAYCVPYQTMAAVIMRDSPASGAVLLVDRYSFIVDPLLNHLGKGVQVITLIDEQSAQRDLETIRNNPGIVWFLRHTHDTSPDEFVTRMEVELARGRTVKQYDYLPYSMPEHWILDWLRGPGQPEYFFRLSEMRQNQDSNR